MIFIFVKQNFRLLKALGCKCKSCFPVFVGMMTAGHIATGERSPGPGVAGCFQDASRTNGVAATAALPGITCLFDICVYHLSSLWELISSFWYLKP